jgi:nucleotide-binding universal stress UspA family protein
MGRHICDVSIWMYFTAMIRTVGLAIAFSPTAERMLAEAIFFARLLEARLVLIHVGNHGQKEEHLLHHFLANRGIAREEVTVLWQQGVPAKEILKACETEKVDLLIAGALKKEGMIQYYLGSIARDIMRKARCSVLLLTQPALIPSGFRNIVVDAEDNPSVRQALSFACLLGKKSKGAWVHVVRELKLYGLAMSASDHFSESEYENLRQGLVKDEIEKVEQLLQKIPHEDLKINIKVLSGKSGFELAKFALRKQADLLVVAAPPRRFGFFDRVFTHDLEYVFANLPCNLLIVQPGKEGSRG